MVLASALALSSLLADPVALSRVEALGVSIRQRCGAMIERVAYPGAPSVVGRRSCRAWPLKGFDHCWHHLTWDERQRHNEESEATRRGAAV